MKKNLKEPINQIYLLLLVAFLMPTIIVGQQSDKSNEFHKAISGNKIEIVKEMLTSDASLLEMPNRRGSTPLTVASSDGSAEIVKYLIEKGANISAQNSTGNTPLHYAGWKGHEKIFKYLVRFLHLLFIAIGSKPHSLIFMLTWFHAQK